MSIPAYLQSAKVADKAIDYKWDIRIQNRIVTTDADRKPALSKAIGKISAKAAFAFAVACAEWVTVRLSQHTDVADAMLRLQAAWAATVDLRYARLSKPDVVDPDNVDPAADPVYMAMRVLYDAHMRYLAGREDRVYLDALILGVLAEHVAGRNPVFKRWAPEVLKRASQQHPGSAKKATKEPAVARESFDLDPPDKATLAASQANLLAGLNPARNRYLAPAAALRAAGIKDPYPKK